MHDILQQSHSCSSPQIKRGLAVSFLGHLLLHILHAGSQRLPYLPWCRRIARDTWTCRVKSFRVQRTPIMKPTDQRFQLFQQQWWAVRGQEGLLCWSGHCQSDNFFFFYILYLIPLFFTSTLRIVQNCFHYFIIFIPCILSFNGATSGAVCLSQSSYPISVVSRSQYKSICPEAFRIRMKEG